MANTPTEPKAAVVDIEELSELEDAARRADVMFPYRMGIKASVVLALIAEVRELRGAVEKCSEAAVVRLRSALAASEAEVGRLKSDLDLSKAARQMLAEDMKRLGDGEPVKLDLADRVRHRIDLLRQRIVELEAPASTSAELADAERAVVDGAVFMIQRDGGESSLQGWISVEQLGEAVNTLLALRAALGLGEQKGNSDV